MFVPSSDPLAMFFFGYFDWWECECGSEVHRKNATPQGAELAEIRELTRLTAAPKGTTQVD